MHNKYMKFLTLSAIKNVLINTTRFGVANIVSSTKSRQGVKAMSTPTYDGPLGGKLALLIKFYYLSIL